MKTKGQVLSFLFPVGFVCMCGVLYLIFQLYGNPLTRRALFDPSSVHAEFVVNKVTVGQRYL
jgi:hypothetical protein